MSVRARLAICLRLAAPLLVAMVLSLVTSRALGQGMLEALAWCEAVGAAAILVAALWTARSTRTLVAAELGVACVLSVALLCALLAVHGMGRDPSAPEVRLVLLWPCALWAAGTLGASFAFVGIGGSWRLPLWLGLRLLRGYSAHPNAEDEAHGARATLAVVTRIAGVGVMLGIWLVLVSLGVLGGFEGDLTRKIMGASPHIALRRSDAQPFVVTSPQLEALRAQRDVVAIAPLLEQEVAIASRVNYGGGLLWGVARDADSKVALPVLSQLPAETTDTDLDACTPLCPVVLGAELAQSLVVGLGDTVRLISPSEVTLTPVGPVPKSLGLRVVGLVQSRLLDFDSHIAIVSQRVAASFMATDAHEVSQLAVALRAPERAPGAAAELERLAQAALGDASLKARSWQQHNQTLFSALALERIVAAVVLAFILLVAAFAVVNTMTMHVFERRSEIAMLRAMGACDQLIVRTFVMQGMAIGAVGAAAGVGLGVLTTQLLARFRFGIPDEVYYIDALPVELSAADVAWVVMAGLVMLWDFSVWPSLKAAALPPVEGLRDC